MRKRGLLTGVSTGAQAGAAEARRSSCSSRVRYLCRTAKVPDATTKATAASSATPQALSRRCLGDGDTRVKALRGTGALSSPTRGWHSDMMTVNDDDSDDDIDDKRRSVLVTTVFFLFDLVFSRFPAVMSRSTQLLNLAQLFLAPLPACLLSRHLLNEGAQIYTHGWVGLPMTISASLSPFALANLLLAFSLFLGWLASLLQRSTWLIDPYWTLVPPLLDLFYKTACSSSGKKGNFSSSSPLATAATLLLLLWSMRLTHSYFRREKWEVGRREDWRYAEMRGRWGRHWWWWQLVPVYLVQHLLLVGLALPSFALRCCSSSSSPSGGCLPSCVFSSSASSSARSSSGRLPLSYGQLGGFLVSRRRGGAENAAAAASVPWHPLFDSLAVAAALSGLLLALFADSQLHAFVSSREEERKRGDPARVLDSGLWALSRHPNYLGETIFHLSLAALAVSGRYFSGSAGGRRARRLSPSRFCGPSRAPLSTRRAWSRSRG